MACAVQEMECGEWAGKSLEWVEHNSVATCLPPLGRTRGLESLQAEVAANVKKVRALSAPVMLERRQFADDASLVVPLTMSAPEAAECIYIVWWGWSCGMSAVLAELVMLLLLLLLPLLVLLVLLLLLSVCHAPLQWALLQPGSCPLHN